MAALQALRQALHHVPNEEFAGADEAIDQVERLLAAAEMVESWWLQQGKHAFGGAPAAIFELRRRIEDIKGAVQAPLTEAQQAREAQERG